MGQVAADLFKFMTLRSPQNTEHEKDAVKYIRDKRIALSYASAEKRDPLADGTVFARSHPAAQIFSQVKAGLPQDSAAWFDVLAVNRQIAETIGGMYGIHEKTGLPWVDDFVSVIRAHLKDFDKSRLLRELDAIIIKHLPQLGGIAGYLEKAVFSEVDPGRSTFCIDYDKLFDRLYVLYVCKRNQAVSLEAVLDGLRALHVVRFLYLDGSRPRQGCLTRLLALIPKIIQRAAQWAGGKSGTSITTGNPESTEATPAASGGSPCAVARLTLDGAIPLPAMTIATREALTQVFRATPLIHSLFGSLTGYYRPFNNIKPIGVGDLLVVKQFLCGYAVGEIAHVENVLKGESKERTHRRLDRNEETVDSEMVMEEENQKELQTTSRFELQAETATTMQNDFDAQVSLSVSGKYGAVEVTAASALAYSFSKTDAQRSASNFSKDIVDRSLNKIQKRVREERTTKKIWEIEEINKHGLNNVKGGDNISGIYCWLDKHYKAQIYNYGKRLMFEFVIPEPAAFIKAVVEARKAAVAKPGGLTEPETPNVVIGQITQDQIQHYAEAYQLDVANLGPQPVAQKVINVECNNDSSGTRDFSVDIEKGYQVTSAVVQGKCRGTKNSRIAISIGGQMQEVAYGIAFLSLDLSYQFAPPIEGKLAIGVNAMDMNQYQFNVLAQAELTETARLAWQMAAFSLIMNGYKQRRDEYLGQLADYQSKMDAYAQTQTTTAQGLNPKTNQEIINLELKKHCLTMFTKQFAGDAYRADAIDFNSMQARSETLADGTAVPFPAIDIDRARETGTLIQFLEQAFEWTQISYLLYPYFWGKLPDWWFEAQDYYAETDPVFAKFLQAGSARVLVAVQPAYETAVMHYLYTREPWNGGDAPGIGDPLYVPIYEELRNQQDDLNGAEPYGDPWQVVVPTSLVYLQPGNDLPEYDCSTPGGQA